VTLTKLAPQLKTVPTNPGVYLFKNEQGNVLYVGKAANLSNRVRSYFMEHKNLPSKIQRLMSKISDIEFIVTNSEQEALILECSLIKKYRPRYNVRLKDDKTFPYLKINITEDWPGVYVTRRFQKDGARYFGPFASAGSVRKTLRLIKKIFPFRSCTKTITGRDKKPCLEYHIHRCLGPCIGAVTREEYHEMINQVIQFLEGKQELVLRQLNQKMMEASHRFQFEKAALLRDQIKAIEKVIEAQKIAVTLKGEQDVIALAQDKGLACVEIFFIRNNKLVGRDHFIMENIYDETPNEIITSFVKQYYASASYIPPLILLRNTVNESATLTEWLKGQRGNSVKLQVPERGAKKQLMNMAIENANKELQLAKAREMNLETITSALQQLKDKLCLPRIPLRIECYDISDIQGALAVGSMIVLEKGMPKPAHYRRFKIKTITGADDYAMIQEVLKRRFRRTVSITGKENELLSQKDSWAIIPDLILIDGGKGQLNAAVNAIKELEVHSVPVASIAKENEDVFIPGRSEPLDIPKDSPALHTLQRARDEAHRFAVSYHQRLRRKKGIASLLDNIPGIGPKRKKALIIKFRSVKGIKEASLEELSQTESMTLALAKKVKEYL
jgi:excinuclease ABC subunit C